MLFYQYSTIYFLAENKMRKRVILKKRKQNKPVEFWKKVVFYLLLFSGLVLTTYHYREALLYYFSFKTDKKFKEDKIAQARIYQILNKYPDKVVGIDVSHYQGKIDWSAVTAIDNDFPVKFVFVRASVGNNKVDERFQENWSGAKKYNFIRGAYHYYRPNENSVTQARLFIKTVKLQKGDLPPVLDIEKLPKEQSIDSLKIGLKRWLSLVDAHYKVKPIIYTSERYYTDFLKAEFSEYTFWVANYNFFAENLKDDWLFWQFTEKGQIKGINEKVDINIFNGSIKMLNYITIAN